CLPLEWYKARMSHGPLQGVKVVSCSTAQAGTVPYMLMADLGADVIKIEVPKGGDPSRRMTVLPGMPSTFFETNNRGVKSVTLNLKTPEGRAILHKLAARADIFGQNFRPGAAEKNGSGWEELRKINPRLVSVALSVYGPKGDLSLLGGQIRLMGWTLTTAMWRNQNPVTGQARITGTAQRPGISASFNDRDGKPLVFQLTGPDNWSDAMTALGFYPHLKK